MARSAATAQSYWTQTEAESDAPAERARVEAEAAASVAEWFRNHLGLSADELARTLDVSDRTIKRWLQRQAGPAAEHRARLRKLHQVRYLMESVFASPTAAVQWFHAPVRSLRGHAPVDAMTEGRMDDVIGLLAQSFPTAADRTWLRLFMDALVDERERFYRQYWLQQQRDRAGVVRAVDSLWHRSVRPRLQRYLSNTQQPSGDFILSLPLDGEGRTVKAGARDNIVAVTFPVREAEAAEAIYVFAHEVALAVAGAAVADNITPAERRSGAGARYESAAAVRAGLLLLEKVAPELADGYARYYLRSAGLPVSGAPRDAIAGAFPLPSLIAEAIARQIDVVLGGI